MLAQNQTLPSLQQFFLHAGTYNYLLVTNQCASKEMDTYYLALYQYRPGQAEPRLLSNAQAIRSLLLSCKRHDIHKCNPTGPCVKSMRPNEEVESAKGHQAPTPGSEEDIDNAINDAARELTRPRTSAEGWSDGSREKPSGLICEDCNARIIDGSCACHMPYLIEEDVRGYAF